MLLIFFFLSVICSGIWRFIHRVLPEFRLPWLRACEICTFEIGVAEIGTNEVGLDELGTGEIAIDENRLRKGGTIEIDSPETNLTISIQLPPFSKLVGNIRPHKIRLKILSLAPRVPRLNAFEKPFDVLLICHVSLLVDCVDDGFGQARGPVPTADGGEH